jgi:hypothetical protein
MLLKTCSCCKQTLSVTEFRKHSTTKDRLDSYCKQCKNQYGREYRQKNKERIKQQRKKYRGYENIDDHLKYMLAQAKRRAKERQLDFDIDLDYLRSIFIENCPVDGEPLDWGRTMVTNQDNRVNPRTPSLDRNNSTFGYTKDNVAIISHRWNTWKSNMSIQDVKALYKYMQKLFP